MEQAKQTVWTYASDFEDYVYLIVEAKTGVEYAEQVSGHYCMAKSCEGFLVPIASDSALLADFFKRFGGVGPMAIEDWSAQDINELTKIVSQFRTWVDMKPIQLDHTRLSETTEAWVRVITPYGSGVLVFPNSD